MDSLNTIFKDDITADAYLPAWDIDHFPYDVKDSDGSKKAPKVEFNFEEDTTSK